MNHPLYKPHRTQVAAALSPHFPSAQHPHNMHLSQVFFALVMISGVLGAPQTTKRPEITEEALEKALSDKRYLMRQLKCALGEASCDPVGRRLKSLAPLVLRGSCPQCTPMEMRQIQKVLAHVQRNFPQEWSKVISQYAG